MPLSIFIIDDNDSLRTSLAAMLQDMPRTEVVGWSSGEVEALTWLVSNPDSWSVVVVDMFLRDGNGLGVLAGCRVRKAAQKLVVLTNYATPEMRRRCVGLGADAVFDKATELEALIKYLRNLNR